jgi:hypothetical protein
MHNAQEESTLGLAAEMMFNLDALFIVSCASTVRRRGMIYLAVPLRCRLAWPLYLWFNMLVRLAVGR